jgi:hypothetical protein
MRISPLHLVDRRFSLARFPTVRYIGQALLSPLIVDSIVLSLPNISGTNMPLSGIVFYSANISIYAYNPTLVPRSCFQSPSEMVYDLGSRINI